MMNDTVAKCHMAHFNGRPVLKKIPQPGDRLIFAKRLEKKSVPSRYSRKNNLSVEMLVEFHG